MRPAEAASCSARSLARAEPLLGTASRYRLWLLVEQPGRWEHDALLESGFPPDVGARLRDLAVRLGMRVALIKRRTRPWPMERRRVFVAFTGVSERRIRRFEVDDPADLLDLDLAGHAGGRFAGLGDPVDGPLFLVCTHGKHDPCCARRGAPLYRALADRPDAWECTHIGGDRFAGNLVCFPHGVYYGRVTPSRAAELAEGYAEGTIDLDHYRGRSCYSPAVQAAEHHIREREGITGVDDLTLVSHRALGGGVHRVGFQGADGRVHEVVVTVEPGEPRLLTCKATERHRARRFSVRDA
ncbi:MAG TPA: sucrase ferredoxin [Actinomycetota bacterium]|nr:sucrase ferredoxin [Actinomycetota bacterium]